MIISKLSPEQIAELRQAHRACKDKRYAYRINAIILLGTGWSYQDVSNALLLDEETLRNYQAQYRRAGLTELLKDGRGGSDCQLSSVQTSKLESELDSAIYMTTQSVIEYVKKRLRLFTRLAVCVICCIGWAMNTRSPN